MKFRIWNKRDKIMIYPQDNEFVIDNKKRLYYVKNDKIQPVDFEYEINFYIGLKDKNGKEIYENDIVEWEDYVPSISSEKELFKTWHKKVRDPESSLLSGAYFKFRDVVKYRYRKRFWLRYESWGYEGENLVNPKNVIVIGNIYENPKLIDEN
jgi:uncharacterized phage protein (TIGR01671 family)